MYTTYHLDSASELDINILEAIKTAFKDKSIVITVEENSEIPEWQKELVLERREYYKQHPEELIEWDIAKNKLRIDG